MLVSRRQCGLHSRRGVGRRSSSGAWLIRPFAGSGRSAKWRSVAESGALGRLRATRGERRSLSCLAPTARPSRLPRLCRQATLGARHPRVYRAHEARFLALRRRLPRPVAEPSCGHGRYRSRISCRRRVMRPLPVNPVQSALLGRVRQRGTKPELLVASALCQLGLGYRKNVKDLPGSPDFANKARKWAVFVNGCFWHRHRGCRRATTPTNNRQFWLDKFERNRNRDAGAVKALRRRGYKIAIVWECQAGQAASRLSKILESCRVDVGCLVDH